MVTVTGAEFALLIADTGLSATNAEYILTQTVDLIKLYGGEEVSLSNLSGTAGSKSLSCTEKQRGAIYMAARNIYASIYKNAANTNVGGAVNISSTDLLSNPTVLASIKEAAILLREVNYSRSII